MTSARSGRILRMWGRTTAIPRKFSLAPPSLASRRLDPSCPTLALTSPPHHHLPWTGSWLPRQRVTECTEAATSYLWQSRVAVPAVHEHLGSRHLVPSPPGLWPPTACYHVTPNSGPLCSGHLLAYPQPAGWLREDACEPRRGINQRTRKPHGRHRQQDVADIATDQHLTKLRLTPSFSR